MTTALSRMTRRRQAGAAPAAVAMVVVVLVAAGLLLASQTGGTEGPAPAAPTVPTGFPVPASAVVVQGGTETAILQMGGTVDGVRSYYRGALHSAGWTFGDEWDGTDPHGRPASGWIVRRDGTEGAVSFTPVDDSRVEIRVNLAQPEYRDEMRGMGGDG